jgi:P27 family predicted phage terminase small subunit
MTGTRGPLPKPNVLKLLQGNPGKRPLNLADGVNPRVEIPSAPAHLGKEARKEWKRVTPLLEELGLISGLDRAALGLYCQAVGRLTELETAFNAKVAAHVADGKDYAEAVYQVSHGLTPNGFAQQSVLFQLLRAHREEVNRYLAHFGLSPAARARVTPSNYLQPGLPGIDEPPAPGSGFAKFATAPR